MCDFTSAHHLGWTHPSTSLPGWPALTTGRPSALDEQMGTPVERAVSELTGLECGIVSRSTLHAGWDLASVLGGHDTALLVDGGSYPTSSVAASTAAARGSTVVSFAHHDVAALDRAIRSTRGRRPVVLTDGWCPGCGNAAPLVEYHRAAAKGHGLLVVDDTQAIGVLGPSGGGTVRRAGLWSPHVAAVSSLAKAFGAPIATTTGPCPVIEQLRRAGPSRTSSSPPTVADMAAACSALRGNAVEGDQRRARLRSLVRRFRRQGEAARLPVLHGDHPAQSIGPLSCWTAAQAHDALVRRGVRAVPQKLRCRPGSALTFLITVRHRAVDIDDAVAAVDDIFRGGSSGLARGSDFR